MSVNQHLEWQDNIIINFTSTVKYITRCQGMYCMSAVGTSAIGTSTILP